MYHFFAYLSRMKLIKRWGLMRNTNSENIQEHSLQVAMIAHGLAVIKNKLYNGTLDPNRVATLAVFHEVAEVITGDLATPIKYYNPEIKNAYGKIEKVAQKRLYEMLPEELKTEYLGILFKDKTEEEEWVLVKAADKISAYVKCLEELKAGNQEFTQAEKQIKKEIEQFALPEIKFFMEKFITSFSLTLDELN